MKLILATMKDLDPAMEIINQAKAHLKAQGIDQWQTGYPDLACIQQDIRLEKGYLIVDQEDILGYLCIDFGGEPAYDLLKGEWASDEPYVVVHRMAFAASARGNKLTDVVFPLVEEIGRRRNVHSFRVDTDGDNSKMQHILKKNGFTYRGTIWFDNSEKIAFDKSF